MRVCLNLVRGSANVRAPHVCLFKSLISTDSILCCSDVFPGRHNLPDLLVEEFPDFHCQTMVFNPCYSRVNIVQTVVNLLVKVVQTCINCRTKTVQTLAKFIEATLHNL